jgi:hypothetical protein
MSNYCMQRNVEIRYLHAYNATPSADADDVTADTKIRYRRSLFQPPVAAGFPLPAEEHIDQQLDLTIEVSKLEELYIWGVLTRVMYLV